MKLNHFNGLPQISNENIIKSLNTAVERVRTVLPRFTYKSQNHSSINNIYPSILNNQWTSGFFPGQIWLSYLYTVDPVFKYAGLIQVESMLSRIEAKIEVDHHDMGFLYSPSCIAAWQITANERAHKAALLAADQMMTRFQEKGGFFQAWGEIGAADNYRYIIDCLMNLPLLYWASAQTGNPIYAQKANIHAQTTLTNSFRQNGSTYHTFFMNPDTGNPVRGETCQGYSDDSSWARGQAWAIYGAALLYRYTKDILWHDVFYNATEYFLKRLPDDLVPYWDLIFTSSDEPRDSSSSAILACGLLEMANLVDNEKAETLIITARQLIFALVENCAATGNTDGLILHGTYSKKSPYNTCTPEGVDECLTWGDYFYLEALFRLYNPCWKSFW